MKKFAKILAAAVLFGTAAGTAFQGAEMIGKNVLVSQNETVKDSASAETGNDYGDDKPEYIDIRCFIDFGAGASVDCGN